MSIQFIEKYAQPIPHQMWAMDYCPNTIKQVVGNPSIVEAIDGFVQKSQIPNMLLYGPNGCCKSTLSKIIAKSYLGTDEQKNHLEIIGSVYRGKNIVSEKYDKNKKKDNTFENPNIVHFIRKNTNTSKCKIVTIYDFDCMTNEAQMAIRRVIEIYSQKVCFIFICNDLHNIIEAVQSRVLVLKFQPLSQLDIINRLKQIADDKQLSLTDDIYEAISYISNGDLKQAINYLQVFSCSNQKQLDNFYNIFNIPPIKTICEFIKACLDKDCCQAFKILDQLYLNGYNVTDILDIIMKVLVHNPEFTTAERAHMIEKTINIICINEQSSSIIHLYRLVFHIMKI